MAQREGLPLGQFRYPLGSQIGADPVPYRNAMIQQAAATGAGFATRGLEGAFIGVLDALKGSTSKQLAEIARVLDQGIAPERMQAIHEEIGRKARDSVVRSYRAARAGQTRGASGYRTSGPWQRYAGGRLLRALQSDNMFEATPRGLEFINVGWLNDQAAQWARLNMGAGPRGRGSRSTFTVVFGGQVVGALGLNESARPGFMIPKGYFWRDGAPVRPQSPLGSPGTEFYVAGTGPRKGTSRVRGGSTSDDQGTFNGLIDRKFSRGIEARNFLDAGLRTIAVQTPRLYLREINDMYDKGISQVRPAPVRIRVPVTSAYRRSSTSGRY